MKSELLAVQHVAAVEADAELPWLVEEIWPEQGVGFLGGRPKSCKSWLALEIALSVASRTPLLGRYAVPRGGPVLVFAAEDSPAMVRARFAGLAVARGVSLKDLPIQLVLADRLRLESDGDQARLRATLEMVGPELLILDPFVRMTGIDENSAQEVSRLLGFLRDLQRSLALAILVVHHVRKSAGNGGLALRGSGDFWAWSDTNLYLHRKQAGLELVIEHRSASAPEPIPLELCDDVPAGPYLGMRKGESESSESPALGERVLAFLEEQPEAVRLDAIRGALRVRMQSVVDVMRELEQSGRVCRDTSGWRRLPIPDSGSHPPGTPRHPLFPSGP